MVGAGEPEDVFAPHAVPPHQDVNLSMFEHVADVQRTCNIGRRDD